MAAHVWTAVNQLRDEHVLRNNPVNWPGLQAALDLSCWTELLDLEDYESLQDVVSKEDKIELAFWLGSVFVKYKEEWVRLGMPTTKEEWNKQWLFLSGVHE